EDAEDNAGRPADFADDHRFHDELSHDVALFRAHRAPDADLASPFGDRDQHDVHDADARSQQRDRADHGDAQAHRHGERLELLDQRISGEDFKIVLFARRHFADHTHDAAHLLDSIVVAGLVAALDQDIQTAAPATEA